MQPSSLSNEDDEFKLSFKPMTQNNGSQNFMTQSPSILMTGYHENTSANSNSLLHNTTPSNLSIFQPMNLNASGTDVSTNNNSNNNTRNLNASNLSMFHPMKAVPEANHSHSANLLNTSHRHLPTDSEVIFYESVPIVVRSSAVESNTRNLTLKIEKLVQLPQNQQILSITLTYESDPFFLYRLSVSENDFHQLKSDQTLLVDFAVFPKSLVMLLRQCLQCKNQEHPKFVAVLVYSSSNQNGRGYAILSVQETNQFRHLQHISLKLCAANNDQLREYLGKSLMAYKAESSTLQGTLNETKQALQRAKADKKQAEQYVNQIKTKYEQCLCDLKTSHSQQISSLKQNHLEQSEEMRKELVNARNDVENELKLQIKKIELKYNKLKDEFDELNSIKMTLENRLKNTSDQLAETKSQFEANKQELSELRTECKRLDQLKFEQEKEINEQRVNLSALQQQVKDKGEINQNNTSLLESERERKREMEEQLKLYRVNLEKSEKKVKECVKEINKGNNIISHLQNEIRNQRNKNKMKEQKLQSMEQMNGSKADDVDRLNADIKERERDIAKYKGQIKELKDTLKACKDKLQESQKAIEGNQRCIKFLSEKLNKYEMDNNMFGGNATNHNQTSTSAMLAGLTPSPFTKSANKYQSPYISNSRAMGGMNTSTMGSGINPSPLQRGSHGISGMSNIGSTAISPILGNNNNNNRKTSPPSSYFPH